MSQPYPSLSPLRTGLSCSCPRCGCAPLLVGALTVRPACPRCGLDYGFVDPGDGPAVFAIFILGFLVLGGALLVEFRFLPPLWVHLLLWGVLTPLLALGLLRLLKATLIALQYQYKAEQGRLAAPREDGAG